MTYKTVKKGDSSLQYTILPQTEQFIGGTNNQALEPKQADKRPPLCSAVLAALIVLFFTGAFVAAMGRQSHLEYEAQKVNNNKILSKYNENIESIIKNPLTNREETLPITPDEILNPKIHDEQVSSTIINQETQASTLVVNSNPELMTITSTSATTERNAKEIELSEASTLFSSPLAPSSSASTNSESTFSTSENTKDTSELTFNDEVESLKSSSNALKKLKMPRVTLKLRENETIPQMYMKAGIASYKKGNITTSVLAHGLSLEGLIFKTPEGTIKPWNGGWPFSDTASYEKWKKDKGLDYPRPGVGMFGIIALILIICAFIGLQSLANRAKGRRHDVEEPPIPDKKEEEEEEDDDGEHTEQEQNDRSELLKNEFKNNGKE